MPSGVQCRSVNGTAVEYKDGDHDVAGSNLLAGIIIIIMFLCTLYNEKKIIFAIENIFKVFLKNEIV
jgi:uncharacterized membrane protein